ncbi:type IV conjugative transfer system lipoprotein TraV [uncultured Nitrosomonas sp.]|uniref:type IV conjugative transfer system lipoprotein TraV n=1 Tax=uncultured Nitrosomonas sp. TaxID=156424 RepID=UPI002631BA7D|nr:type IV conjugative transfer system lipoprotein TraV [uncultured Nitrosomonas sp.]
MNRLYLSIALLSLGGCSTLSGYDGQTSFSCKAPGGVSCTSISGVYANAAQNNLPGLQAKKSNSKEDSGKDEVTDTSVSFAALPASHSTPITGLTPNSGDPILSPAKVLRVWISPWEDEDGDLHDQSYVYMQADYGRWVIEHNQRHIMNEYQPTNLSTGAIAPGKQESATEKPLTAGSYNQQYPNPQSIPDGLNNQQSQVPQDNFNDLEDAY